MTRYETVDRGIKNTVDWKIVFCYIALVLFGWMNIFAAIQSSEPSSIFDLSMNCGKQLQWIGISVVVATILLFVLNPKFWEAFAIPGYLLVLVLLVAVIFLSRDIKGSHSWFSLGPVSFQPAEISKITTSLVLASIMSRTNFRMDKSGNLIKILIVLGLPMLAILGEKETGSVLVYCGFIFVLYREGLSGWFIGLAVLTAALFVLGLIAPWWVGVSVLGVLCLIYLISGIKHTRKESKDRRSVWRQSILVFLIGSAMVFASGFIFNNILQPHQQNRIQVFLGLMEDPRGIGYNVRQSMIAIGSGGAFGKGFLHGTQTAYGFVPEQSTDFIFCTIGEEWGWVGCTITILLFVFMIYRIVVDAENARDPFTRIYGYCVAACIFMNLIINIGMTIGLVPVIGIPLPMLSYGGSSLLAFTIMIFIFLALDRQDKKYY